MMGIRLQSIALHNPCQNIMYPKYIQLSPDPLYTETLVQDCAEYKLYYYDFLALFCSIGIQVSVNKILESYVKL